MKFIKNQTYQTNKDCTTEDWKTALARPKDFPILKKGHQVVFVSDFQNFYGTFAIVKPEGVSYQYYLKYEDLESLSTD
jgi:hypothetical protein